MVDLPQVPRRNPTTRAAQSSLSAADIARPAQTWGEVAATGANVAQEWDAKVTNGWLSDKKNSSDLQRGELSRKFATDPQGFQIAITEFGKTAAAGAPNARAADALGKYIREMGTAELERVRDQQFRVSNAVADDALKARGTALQGRLLSMAREGKHKAPEYASAMSELQQITAEKVRSPMSTYSQAHADLDMKSFGDEATTESLLGGLDRAWDKTPGDPRGKASAVMQRTEEMIEKSDIEDKPGAIKKARAFVSARAAESVQQQAAVRERADGLIEDIKANPAGVDDAEYGEVYASLRGSGQHTKAGALREARFGAKVAGYQMQDPEVRKSAIEGFLSRGNQAASLLREFEGFRTTPYWDVNALRTGYGSDTVTRADGTVEKVTASTTVTKADADRDLNRRVGEFQAGIKKDIGADKWSGLPENMQAALTSVAYNYGRLPTTVSSAVVTGNPEAVAKAIEGLQGHNDGINRDRRLREAAIIRGGAVPIGSSVSPEEVKAYRKDSTKFLGEVWTDVERGLRDGIKPDPATMVEVERYARLADDPDLVAKVSAGLEKYGEVLPATDPAVPVANQLAAAASEGAAMHSSGADPAAVEVWRIKAERAQANEALLKKDPLSFWDVTRPPNQAEQRTAPLNPSQPESFRAELQKRGAAASFVEEAQGVANVSAFRPGEAELLKASWQNGTVEEKTRLLGDLAVLPPKTLLATVAAFADKDETVTLAWAAGLYGRNPAVAQAIVRGEATMSESKAAGGESPWVWNAKEDTRTAIAQSMPALGVGMARAGSAIDRAVKARYADLSYSAQDRSGELNQERFDQALSEVTGGVVEWNDQRVIAPQYGMSQRDFDARMKALASSDLQGASTAKGSSLNPYVVAQNARLVSVADGRYLLQFGEGAGAWFAINRFGGGPFVLDLRDAQ